MATKVMPLAVWVALLAVASSSSLHEKRIINGEEAEPYSHPYIVSLQLNLKGFEEEHKWGHYCGGVVLDQNWVLTAAHCVDGEYVDPKYSRRMKFGEHDLKNDTSFEESRGMQKIVRHENWNSTSKMNDIALIRMDTPVELGGHVQAANLSLDESDLDFKTCVLAGWGYIKGGIDPKDRIDATVLTEVDIDYIPNDLCAIMLMKYIQPNIEIDEDEVRELEQELETKMCAFDLSPEPEGLGSACMGDSGGPMLCGEDHSILVGIAAAVPTEDCNWLSLYTRVSKYRTWISGVIDSYDEENSC